MEIDQEKISGIIYLWPLTESDSNGDIINSRLTTGEIHYKLLNLLQGLAATSWIKMPRLHLITLNSQVVNSDKIIDPIQGSLWGFGRVISLENPEYRVKCIDIDNEEKTIESLCSEIVSDNDENQIVLRETDRFVQRLERSNLKVEPDLTENKAQRLEIKDKGVLENLKLVPIQRKEPAAGTIEIEVFATGLNFRDVLNAMDLYPGDPGPLGGECSGIVSAVGDGVTDLKVGDAVMGIAAGSFASYVITYADLVVKKPENISFEEAATIPITYLTAHYALNHLAKIKKGDRVFIHAASGGVGQAAVQLAKAAGATIFGTAGSDEKRNVVKQLGGDFVMNSRSLDYSDETKKLTENKGVNILLNSLNGEYIPKNLEILAKDGVFLEIGKIDIWDEKKIKEVRPDISYHTIAIDLISEENPALIKQMLKEIIEKISAAEINPIQHTVYDISDAAKSSYHKTNKMF